MSLPLMFLTKLVGNKLWISFYLLCLGVIGVLFSMLAFNWFINFQLLSFHVLFLLCSLWRKNSDKCMIDFGTVFLPSHILSFVFFILFCLCVTFWNLFPDLPSSSLILFLVGSDLNLFFTFFILINFYFLQHFILESFFKYPVNFFEI